MSDASTPAFIAASADAQAVFRAKAAGTSVEPARAIDTLRDALRTKNVDRPVVYAALGSASALIDRDLKQYGAISRVPAAATKNLRNKMYVVQETLGLMVKDTGASARLFPNGNDKKLQGL